MNSNLTIFPNNVELLFLFIIIQFLFVRLVTSFHQEPRLKRTLIKRQTLCQKGIRRIHDIISAKKTVARYSIITCYINKQAGN